ncbi:hypothetical protein LY76DRAFT_550699 [Colletotrichum caudatum]|nr:hypothetical protein LY76DRAFT_550699 [Colletotrichum caudatum]
MAEVAIGTAAGVTGLIGATVTIIQRFSRARKAKGANTELLDHVSFTLQAVSDTLELVEQERQLRTAPVEAQIEAIKTVTLDLREFLDKVKARKDKGKARGFIHSMIWGDADDRELDSLLQRLRNARQELHTRISVAHVGLTGNLQDGYQVAFRVLTEINSKVREGIGMNLTLAERLRNRELQSVDNGIVLLEPEDIVNLGLDREPSNIPENSASKSSNDQRQIQHERLKFVKNTTGDAPKLFVGNLGVETTSKTSNPKANISENQFGNGASFMVADVSDEAAANISKTFF